MMVKHQKIQLIDTINRKMLHKGECIISEISKTNTFTWLPLDKAKTMDEEYYLGQSGYKDISVLYQNLIHINKSSFVSITEDEDEIIGITTSPYQTLTIHDDTSVYKDAIAKLVPIIINKYQDKWQRLWDAFVVQQYAALENYSMVEETTHERDKTLSDDLQHKGTIGNASTNTSTETHNLQGSDTETGGLTNVIDGTPVDSVYPSFSNGSKPIKETNQDTTQTTTYNNHKHETTDTGTLGVSGSNSNTTTFNNSDERDATENESITIEHTRSGNIGVTTSQQMLQSEIDLRNNFNIVNMIYRDLDKILTSYIWK